jgi:hypothetical protein
MIKQIGGTVSGAAYLIYLGQGHARAPRGVRHGSGGPFFTLSGLQTCFPTLLLCAI